MSVEITPNAASRFGELLAGQPTKVIRLMVSAGGCNGFKKDLSISDPAEDDVIIQLGSAVFAMDSITADLVGDARIDWITGVGGSYIDIKISSSTSSCGCGDSFSL